MWLTCDLSLQGMQGSGFDPNYIKLFRLAQLIIEYLLVRSHLLVIQKINSLLSLNHYPWPWNKFKNLRINVCFAEVWWFHLLSALDSRLRSVGSNPCWQHCVVLLFKAELQLTVHTKYMTRWYFVSCSRRI